MALGCRCRWYSPPSLVGFTCQWDTIGAAITILLTETLRISFGTAAVGWDNLVYGTLLVLFIIYLPQGLLGSVLAGLTRREVVRHD